MLGSSGQDVHGSAVAFGRQVAPLYRPVVRAPYTLLPPRNVQDKASQSNIWNMPFIYFQNQQVPRMTLQPQTQRIISRYGFLPVSPGAQATFGST